MKLAFALLLAACASDPTDAAYCTHDKDCPEGATCVLGTGVCARFRNPFDAGIPDLASPDLSVPQDLSGSD